MTGFSGDARRERITKTSRAGTFCSYVRSEMASQSRHSNILTGLFYIDPVRYQLFKWRYSGAIVPGRLVDLGRQKRRFRHSFENCNETNGRLYNRAKNRGRKNRTFSQSCRFSACSCRTIDIRRRLPARPGIRKDSPFVWRKPHRLRGWKLAFSFFWKLRLIYNPCGLTERGGIDGKRVAHR
jgi:hypothetical protein